MDCIYVNVFTRLNEAVEMLGALRLTGQITAEERTFSRRSGGHRERCSRRTQTVDISRLFT